MTMKNLITAICCIISLSLLSQNNGVSIEIEVANAPNSAINGQISFLEQGPTVDISINPEAYSGFYFNLEEWEIAVVSIEDCNGDSLIATLLNDGNPNSFYTVSFIYCQSDTILGCTDPNALNFISYANEDDGSCIYSGPENDLCSAAIPLEEGTVLIDNTYALQNEGNYGECWNFGSGEGEQSSLWFTFTTPADPSQIHIETLADDSWSLTDTQFGLFYECGGDMIYCDGNSGEGLFSAFDFSCGELDTNATYILMIDGWNGDVGTCFLNYSVTYPCDFPTYGCTDPLATNFDPQADEDDGSCTYSCTPVYFVFEYESQIPVGASDMYWTLSHEGSSIVAEGGFFDWGTEYEFCLDNGCYTLDIYNILPDWVGYYSIFMTGGGEYFGVIDGSSEFYSIPFGVNSPECASAELEGCTDPNATNYNPLATIDDGSCEYFECEANELQLSLNTQNWGYEISWNIRNDQGIGVAGSGDYESYSDNVEHLCLENGCYTFELFDSFGDGWNGAFFELTLANQLLASGTLEDGEFGEIPFALNADCQVVIEGCTDPTALNYNPQATTEDGSCEYFECDENSVNMVLNTINWGNEISWVIQNEVGMQVAESSEYADNSSYSEFLCLGDGCYELLMYDSYGDGWNDATFELMLENEIIASGTLEQGEFGVISFGVNTSCEQNDIYGCTDPSAINYNPEATINDGTCEYACTEVFIGFDFFGSAPEDSSNYEMYWILFNLETQEAYDGFFYNWAPQYDLCLPDGCYEFQINNISPDWDGLYDVFANNEVIAQGEFDGSSEFFTFTFGVNTNGCGDTSLVYGCTDPAAINYNPNANIDDGSCEYSDFDCGISFEVFADTSGENVFYILPSPNIVNASEVLWDFGDGATSNELYPSYIYETDGPFTVCLFVTFVDDQGNYCEISYCEVLDGEVFGENGVLSEGFMINVIPQSTLSSSNTTVDHFISVYPNPTADITLVSFTSSSTDQIILRVMDLQGKVLERITIANSSGEQQIAIDFSKYPQGLYLVGLTSNNATNFAKVVRR